jgi:hypothetical protein
MRIAFLFAAFFFGIQYGLKALATVNEYQELQAEKFCQINPNYCSAK